MVNENFELIVRIVFLRDNKILLCKQKTEDYYFLPGGHVEFGESAGESVVREIREELGAEAGEVSFIGAVENIFSDLFFEALAKGDEGGKHHELNLVFSAKLDKEDAGSLEDHLEFAWVETSSLENQTIYPITLKNSLIKWLEDGKIFWAGQKE